jgi:hypothetical protein
MGKDKRGAGDAADLAGAGGDVLEDAPALGEQREPAFSQAAQGAEHGVAGFRRREQGLGEAADLLGRVELLLLGA